MKRSIIQLLLSLSAGLLLALGFLTPHFNAPDDAAAYAPPEVDNLYEALLIPPSSAALGIPMLQDGQAISGSLIILREDPRYFPARVPPPPRREGEIGIQGVPFTVNYNPGSCSGTTTNWPADAQTAFSYAAGIWSTLITGTQTIVIDACWRTDLGGSTLGSAGATTIHRDFSGAPFANTWYPVALANQLAGSDLNLGTAEIKANFNATKSNWYYDPDGNTPAGDLDFISVVLHEIGHGLGFSGRMDWDDGNSGNGTECNDTIGTGCWGSYPSVYDKFTENGSNQNLITVFANNSIALGNQLIGDDLFFDGTNTKAANGNNPAKLYAPNPWDPGSSYSHLDEIFNNTPHALMTYSLANGESAHHPGAVTLGLFRDIGWPVQTGAELRIVKSASASVVGGGDTINYTISITNDGTVAVNNIVITDTVPDNATLDTASLSGATYSGTGPGSVITWNTGQNLTQGQSLARTFTITAATGVAAAGTVIANTAYVSVSDMDDILRSNTVVTRYKAGCGFSDDFETGKFGDEWTTYTTGTGRARVAAWGGTFVRDTYSVYLDDSVTFSNNYAAIVLMADLSDRSDVNLDFWWRSIYGQTVHADDGVYISDDDGGSWTKVSNFGTNTTYQNSVLDLDALATANGKTLNDQFRIKFQFYSWAGQGYFIDDVQITCGPHLQISKTVDQSTATPNSAITYTLTVTNASGTDTATNVTITDTVPANTALDNSSLSGGGSESGGLITWATGESLTASQTLTRTFVVTVNNGVADGTEVANTAYVSATNATANKSSNTVTTTVNVSTESASLTLTKSASPVSVDTGGLLTYTLVATNTGSVTAINIVLTDTVPINTAFQSASDSGTESGGVVTWNTGISLTTNEAVTRTFVVTVAGGLANGSTIANTGYVSASNATASTASNTLNTTVKAPDLNLTKSASSPAGSGGPLTYTLVVQNNGTGMATGVTLTDTVPANTQFNWASDSGSEGGGVVTWNLGDITLGQILTRTFVVTVNSNVLNGTNIANTGYASATNVSTSQASNTVNSTVSGPDMNLVKSADSTVVSGGLLTYTLVAQNNGIATATGVTITDTVPTNTAFKSASDSGSESGEVVTWSTGQDLAAGEALTRTFVVTVNSGLPNGSNIANTGYVSATNISASKAGNTVNTSVLAPGLDITKTVEVNAVRPGNVLTYTITLVNDGNANLTGVKITDTVPANTQLAFASDSPDTSGTTAGSIVTWTIGGLNINISVTRTMAVTVDGGTGHGTTITNIAYGSADPSVTASDSITAIVDSKVPTNTILITPTSGITVSNPVMFQWSAADWTGSDSGFYRLVVTGSNDSISIQEATDSITTTQTSYTPTNLSTGFYTWTVAAEDKAGNTLVVGPAYFQVAGSGQEVYLPIILKNN